MRIVLLATSPFALPVLSALASSEHDLAAVVTRPARPAGRGRRPRQPAVHSSCTDLGIQLLQPPRITGEFILEIAGMEPDVMVSAAYGAWLPEELLSAAPLGVVNVHPSLLPLYRGAAPVQRAILDGASETGVTFMLTDAGWDTGLVLRSIPERIRGDDTAGTLERRLAELAGREIVTLLEDYREGIVKPLPQRGDAVYAEKISTEESWLDWQLPAEELDRTVRAFQPRPGARTARRGRIIKIISSEVVKSGALPGEACSKGGELVIGCAGESGLRILTLQPESKRPMSAEEYLRGAKLKGGETFERT